MKKIIAFGASTSSKSINQQLAKYAAEQSGLAYDVINLIDFETPIYNTDRESQGFPHEIHEFNTLIQEADGIIISFAEHNGNVTAAFKNLYDWVSRLNRSAWAGKHVFLMATSPGGHGGQSVLNSMTTTFGFAGAQTVASFSLPSFYENFMNGITNESLKASFDQELTKFKTATLEELLPAN